MKTLSRTAALAAIVLGVGCTQCSTAGTPATQTGGGSQQVTQPEVPLACTPQPGSEALTERASPYDSVRINIGGAIAQVCYSRPSAKGRAVFGALVPYNRLWRTGANEPTILHLPFAAEIAGIRVEPGSYSIYTVPTDTAWTVIVNRSVSQWGHESQYKPDIQAQEVGRGQVPSQHLDDHVELFTMRTEAAGATGADLVLEWERTRVRVPIRRVG
jgi:hypothetical protein